MADQLLIKALTQAFSLNIPILYTPTPETPLHIDNRLSIDDNGVATPIMRFTRNDEKATGTDEVGCRRHIVRHTG